MPLPAPVSRPPSARRLGAHSHPYCPRRPSCAIPNIQPFDLQSRDLIRFTQSTTVFQVGATQTVGSAARESWETGVKGTKCACGVIRDFAPAAASAEQLGGSPGCVSLWGVRLVWPLGCAAAFTGQTELALDWHLGFCVLVSVCAEKSPGLKTREPGPPSCRCHSAAQPHGPRGLRADRDGTRLPCSPPRIYRAPPLAVPQSFCAQPPRPQGSPLPCLRDLQRPVNWRPFLRRK